MLSIDIIIVYCFSRCSLYAQFPISSHFQSPWCTSIHKKSWYCSNLSTLWKADYITIHLCAAENWSPEKLLQDAESSNPFKQMHFNAWSIITFRLNHVTVCNANNILWPRYLFVLFMSKISQKTHLHSSLTVNRG